MSDRFTQNIYEFLLNLKHDSIWNKLYKRKVWGLTLFEDWLCLYSSRVLWSQKTKAKSCCKTTICTVFRVRTTYLWSLSEPSNNVTQYMDESRNIWLKCRPNTTTLTDSRTCGRHTTRLNISSVITVQTKAIGWLTGNDDNQFKYWTTGLIEFLICQ